MPFIIVRLIVFAISPFYANQGLILCSHMGPNSPKTHYLPGRVDFLQKQKLKLCSWEGTKMRSFGGRPRFGLWLESRSFYVKKCDPRSHSVQSRGDVDVVLGGSVDHFTRPEGLRRREPMCPVLKSGGGLKEGTKLLYQLIMKSLLL